MLQVLQSLRDGSTSVAEVPTPSPGRTQLLVRTAATVISPGTERMLVDFGRAGWIEKARSQPDKVRQVVEKLRTDGIGPTLESVRAKLDQPIALGYCQAGIVESIGSAVQGFSLGDRVVTNGPHAEYVRVAPTLAARIPDGVAFAHAAFTPLAAIALHGLRLASPSLGETVVVYGLGVIGQLAVQLARAAGCRVIAIDRAPNRISLAETFGARGLIADKDADIAAAVLGMTAGIGVDIVLLTLASESDDPIHLAATMSRKRGRIVLVGVSGLSLRRDDFYKKELSFQVSCSYGPGRYDALHEEQGIDYPLPFVRWTEGRNFSAVLDLMSEGRLDVAPLISHQVPIAEAQRAYAMVAGGVGGLGIVLTYPRREAAERRTLVTAALSPAIPGSVTVGLIGAGSFGAKVLVPALKQAGATLELVASSAGTSGAIVAQRHGFRRATSDAGTVCEDPAVMAVFIATRHDSHADWALCALRSRKHVFVEKPLALNEQDVEAIAEMAWSSGRVLCVGFNRRFARDVQSLHQALGSRVGPLHLVLTINAGALPRDHWTQDLEAGGGRLAGEGCHFIDLARHLVGSPISDAFVTVARQEKRVVDDIAVISMMHADGSSSTVHYISSGHKGFPKERVEAFWDGKTVRLDNLRRVQQWGTKIRTPGFAAGQDKGHARLISAFVEAVSGKAPAPISLDEIVEVSRLSIRVAEVARTGGGRVDVV